MSRRFQVTLRGSGFSVPVDGGERLRGFYTIRRVLANTPMEAECIAIASLQQEEKLRSLIEVNEGNRNVCSVELERVAEISWFAWHFLPNSRSFIFFTDDGALPPT